MGALLFPSPSIKVPPPPPPQAAPATLANAGAVGTAASARSRAAAAAMATGANPDGSNASLQPPPEYGINIVTRRQRKVNYNYSQSKTYCEQLGLVWLGDDWVRDADKEASLLGMTQEQVDSAMRHHLWQVWVLFTPQTYKWYQRIGIAGWFLSGRWKK